MLPLLLEEVGNQEMCKYVIREFGFLAEEQRDTHTFRAFNRDLFEAFTLDHIKEAPGMDPTRCPSPASSRAGGARTRT